LVAACSQSYGGGSAAASPEPTPPPLPVLDPVGTYDFQTEAMGSPVNGTFTITGSPGSYRGNMTTNIGSFSLSDISVDGEELTVFAESPDVFVVFVLAFVGSSFTGEWDAEGMSGVVSGSKR